MIVWHAPHKPKVEIFDKDQTAHILVEFVVNAP